MVHNAGVIVGSSIAGLVVHPGGGAYSASKYALEALVAGGGAR
jgi:NADP-dependent 3-hydroxy acid dehydrogenase YdfG